MIPLEDFLVLGAVLFAIGLVGALVRRNAIIVLMSIELMLTGANLTLLAYGRARHDVHFHALAFLVIAVAAAEAAVGLSILIAIYRSRRNVNLDALTLMRR